MPAVLSTAAVACASASRSGQIVAPAWSLRVRLRSTWPGGGGGGGGGGRVPQGRAESVGEGGAQAQDQDGQAGHGGGDAPWRMPGPGLGEEVVGDLPGHTQHQRADRGPAGEPAGPGGHRRAGGQPGPQCVGRISFDADRQGDRGVDVEGIPDSWQGVDLPESRHLADPDPSGPDRHRCGQGQDDQRPRPRGQI